MKRTQNHLYVIAPQKPLPESNHEWSSGKSTLNVILQNYWPVIFKSPCLFNLYAEYIMRNAGLEEAQAGIKIAGRNINSLRYADDTTLMAESKEELSPLDESEGGEWKSWLKAQHSEN